MATTNPTCNHPGCTEEVYDEESGLCWPDWLAIVVPQFFVEADEHRDWLAEELHNLEAYHG